jgi:hypothetical protein
VLEGTLNDQSTKLPVVILLHGLLGHRHYHFFPRLAQQLAPCVSLYSYDSRGCGGSGGNFEFGAYPEDVEDLRDVVAHFRSQGRTVAAVIGHSRGAGVVLLYGGKYLANVDEAKEIHGTIPIVCSLSARYDMKAIPDKYFKQYIGMASFDWVVKKTDGDKAVITVTGLELDTLGNLDMSVVRKIAVPVLTCHGDADTTIPVADAYAIDKYISQHTLCILPGENHNFISDDGVCEAVVMATDKVLRKHLSVKVSSPL